MQSEGSSYKVTIFKNSEKPTGLHPLLSGIGNERVNLGTFFLEPFLAMFSTILINQNLFSSCCTDMLLIHCVAQAQHSFPCGTVLPLLQDPWHFSCGTDRYVSYKCAQVVIPP